MVLLPGTDHEDAPALEAAASLPAHRLLPVWIGIAGDRVPDVRGRRHLATVLAAAALAGLAAAPARAADQGIQLVSSQRLDGRLTELTLSTPALANPTQVRVLLPAGYRRQKPRRYPVLYLLHGAFGNDRDWTDKGAAQRITAGRKLIVVMPDGGQGGWYTDWVNRGAGGFPEWETFHVGELVPWIDDRYRTLERRGDRGIAGLSMGGFGAMSYAARHPALFSWAGSFSGAVDIVNYLPVAAIVDLEAPVDGGLPGDQFGDRVLAEPNWRAHNPWDLAENLRNTALVIDTGNGRPGPLDPPNGSFDPIESGVHEMSASLHQRLLALGIPHTWNDYGPGTHSWPYWQRDLSEAVPSMMRSFKSSRRGKSKPKHKRP
jgi:S-formylglutathione hydrolase FrmB